MKAYIRNVNWADEGDIFFFSLASEEMLEAMKELVLILSELGLINEEEMYWGTNEWFSFNSEDFLNFISEAEDISESELKVFTKFEVSGYDIYKEISDILSDIIYHWDNGYIKLAQDILDKLKIWYIKLFGVTRWDSLMQHYRIMGLV